MTNAAVPTSVARSSQIQVFRRAEAPTLEASGVMAMAPMSPAVEAGIEAFIREEEGLGHISTVLVNLPGFSLVHLWFKSGYPLPVHSHETDCLYHVVAGFLDMGSTRLEAGDSFFVPANANYGYTAGEEGVEVLEFRHVTHFEMRIPGDRSAPWDRAVEILRARREGWREEPRPQARGEAG